MNKKEEFKAFISNHPELISYVKDGSMSWQKFYEIYDIYGEKEDAWNRYFKEPEQRVQQSTSSSVAGLADKLKNIDMNSIQEHIKTAQKALNLVQELTAKGADNISDVIKGPTTPRPLNKFFED